MIFSRSKRYAYRRITLLISITLALLLVVLCILSSLYYTHSTTYKQTNQTSYAGGRSTQQNIVLLSKLELAAVDANEKDIRLIGYLKLGKPLDLKRIKEALQKVGGDIVKETSEYVDAVLQLYVVEEAGVPSPRQTVYVRFYKDGRILGWIPRGELGEWALIVYYNHKVRRVTTVIAEAIRRVLSSAYPLLDTSEILKKIKYYTPEYPNAKYIVIAYGRFCSGADTLYLRSTYHIKQGAKVYVMAILLATTGGDIDIDRIDDVIKLEWGYKTRAITPDSELADLLAPGTHTIGICVWGWYKCVFTSIVFVTS